MAVAPILPAVNCAELWNAPIPGVLSGIGVAETSGLGLAVGCGVGVTVGPANREHPATIKASGSSAGTRSDLRDRRQVWVVGPSLMTR